jgi:hypothetical protein
VGRSNVGKKMAGRSEMNRGSGEGGRREGARDGMGEGSEEGKSKGGKERRGG